MIYIFENNTLDNVQSSGSFFLFLTSLLEYNCFTMVCQFLLYNKVNQLYVYIYPHIPSLLSLPPTLPIPPPRWSQSIELISLCYAQLPTSHPFYIWQCMYVNATFSLRPSFLFPPPVSSSPFSTSASLFLPCHQVHQYRSFRFHVCALAYGICFSLSDLLHSV